MESRISSEHNGMTATLLAALPAVVIILSVLTWITALSHSGFWADDFVNLLHYNKSLGDLSYHQNQGKYVINFFWALGTLAFGLGSVIPFLILNALVFATGVVVWLWAGSATRWSATVKHGGQAACSSPQPRG